MAPPYGLRGSISHDGAKANSTPATNSKAKANAGGLGSKQSGPVDSAENSHISITHDSPSETHLNPTELVLPSDISQMELLKLIWSKVARIDSIEATVNNMVNKIAKVQDEQNDMKKTIQEMEQGLNFMGAEVESIKQEKAENTRVQALEAEVASIKRHMVDNSNRMRRNNIVLHNIPEGYEYEAAASNDDTQSTDGAQATEDVPDGDSSTEDTVNANGTAGPSIKTPEAKPKSMKEFIENFILANLGLKVEIDAAHRTNRQQTNAADSNPRPRLIHARCLRRWDRDIILRTATKLKDKTFKGNAVYITDDIDPATREEHKKLVPIMKDMRENKGYFAYIPWSVPRVIRYKQGGKERKDLPLKTYLLKTNGQ